MWHIYDNTTAPLSRRTWPQPTAVNEFTVRSTEITAALLVAVTIMGSQVGFTPEDVSACSMSAGRAMALIMARVDTDRIRLVGGGAAMQYCATSTR